MKMQKGRGPAGGEGGPVGGPVRGGTTVGVTGVCVRRIEVIVKM